MSRSIKDAAESGAASGPETGAADPNGHEKFLADLADFTDGEQAARGEDAGSGEGDGATDGDPK